MNVLAVISMLDASVMSMNAHQIRALMEDHAKMGSINLFAIVRQALEVFIVF